MSIRTQTPPDVSNYPKVNIFNRDDFNNALWENGFSVDHYEAIACPCKGTSSDHKSDCSNCLGTGWVFINPINTKAFITSINRTTKYKDWSPEMIGTIAVTLMNSNKIGFMDKLVMKKHYGMMSEDLTVRTNLHTVPTYQRFAFATYGMTEINSVFVFNGPMNALVKLAAADYRINPVNNYVIDIKSSNLPAGFNGKVSVSYHHYMTYQVIDIPHDLRITKSYMNSGKRVEEEMPVQAIARKSQYEMGKASNYEGDNIQDNSYL